MQLGDSPPSPCLQTVATRLLQLNRISNGIFDDAPLGLEVTDRFTPLQGRMPLSTNRLLNGMARA